jgi:hypothetical protein
MQKCGLRFVQMPLFEASNIKPATRHGVANDAHQGRLPITRSIQD